MIRNTLTIAFGVSILTAGCSLFSDSIELDFDFTEQTPGQVVEPLFDPSTISSGQIIFAGQLNTPVPCYRLISELDDRGNALTLEIRATRSTSAACGTEVGRFIYSGAIRNLNPGTYALRVRLIYDVSDWPPIEFNHSLNVR
ncbi:MAG TPA: hypothetical protein VGD49_06335 [Longimicrobiales bacterium]